MTAKTVKFIGFKDDADFTVDQENADLSTDNLAIDLTGIIRKTAALIAFGIKDNEHKAGNLARAIADMAEARKTMQDNFAYLKPADKP